jgi:polar amino acid transport system substrate-binding protein
VHRLHAGRHALPALFLSLALGAFAHSAAVASPVAIEGGYPFFPPFGFTNERGEADGWDVRMANMLFTKAGIPSRSAIYPAARLVSNLKTGASNFSILVRVPGLESCCIYSKESVMHDELRVYRRNGKPAVRHKEDLAGKSIITIHGYSYGGMISYFNDNKNRIVNNATTTHDAAFAMLRAGRADYAVIYGAGASQANPAALAGFKYDVIAQLDIHLVLSKNYPDAGNLMARLETLAKGLNRDAIFHPPKAAAAQP